jgi:hypothetical protein
MTISPNTAGTGAWGAVNIQDLALFFELLLAKVLQGEDVPSANKVFPSLRWEIIPGYNLDKGLANELHKQGILKTAEVKHLSL